MDDGVGTACASHETAFQYLGLISMGFSIDAYGNLIGAGGGFLFMSLLLLIYHNVQ
jgi:hypothetical protein